VLVAAKSAVNAISDKRNFQRILMPVLLPGLLTSGLLCLEVYVRLYQTVCLLMNILHIIKEMKCNWNGQIFRRNCLLKHVIERKIDGRIEVTGRRGIILKQLLNDVKEKRGYWKLKEETPACTVCRTSFGRVYGPLLRQTT